MTIRMNLRGDFVSLDEGDLLRQRDAAGNLPEVNLLCPAADSVVTRSGAGLTPDDITSTIGAFRPK